MCVWRDAEALAAAVTTSAAGGAQIDVIGGAKY